jgi:hypothetical protein
LTKPGKHKTYTFTQNHNLKPSFLTFSHHESRIFALKWQIWFQKKQDQIDVCLPSQAKDNQTSNLTFFRHRKVTDCVCLCDQKYS